MKTTEKLGISPRKDEKFTIYVVTFQTNLRHLVFNLTEIVVSEQFSLMGEYPASLSVGDFSIF